MSCGADGPLGRPALCPGPGFDTGSRRPVARHVSGQGSWSAAGKRSRRRRSGLPAVVRGPAVYGSRPPRPVCRFCRSCGVRGLAGEDAGGGFEFRSRFDDMLRGARGLGVNGQGIAGGKVNVTLDTEPEGPRYSVNSSKPIDPNSGVPKPKSAKPNAHSSGYSGSSSDTNQVPDPHGLNHLTTGLWSAPLRVPFASSLVRCSSVSSFMEWSS